MTTKISAIIDSFNALCAARLTGYAEMAKPEAPEDESNLILQKGYGVFIGPAENGERDLDCITQITRQLALVLVTEMPVTEHDATGRMSVKKSLLEDQWLMIKAVEQDFALTNPDQTAANAVWKADSGLAYTATQGGGEFVFIISYFDVTYLETLHT